MNDFLAAIGQWIDARITSRGPLYKIAVGLAFVIVIGLFASDITQTVRGTE
ncbi:MAG: hypothetical protein AAF771_11430 [Pseudomonadota bacterium]